MELNPFSFQEARGKASSAKLLDQPLAGLNGELRAKLMISLIAHSGATKKALGEAVSWLFVEL